MSGKFFSVNEDLAVNKDHIIAIRKLCVEGIPTTRFVLINSGEHGGVTNSYNSPEERDRDYEAIRRELSF